MQRIKLKNSKQTRHEVTYSILKLDKRIGRKRHTHAIVILFPDFDLWHLTSRPRSLDRDFPEANIATIDKGDEAATGVAFFQPGTPADTVRGAKWDEVGV